MKLKNAATYFDSTTCKDGYTGSVLFDAQIEVYDDSRRDGYSVERRILSTAPAVVVPSRRVLEIDGDHWLVGQVAKDFFRGEVIRHKYIIHRAEETIASVYSIAGLLATTPTPTSTLYVAVSWTKTTKEIDESSTLSDYLTFYAAESESFVPRTVIKVGSTHYLLRNGHTTPSGFNAGEGDELDPPNIETASFVSRVYNPVASSYADTTISVKCLRVRWQAKFDYFSMSSMVYQSGDDVVMVRKADVTPKAGDKLTLSDGDRSVVSVLSDGDCWHLHVRRV